MLWFAFILLSLSYWKQRTHSRLNRKDSCDLLSFYYLCRTGNNPKGQARRIYPVVICFHFTIFVVLETTWSVFLSGSPRCDLLSFYYLCRTGNNNRRRIGRADAVVICFHFTIFVVLETTFWTLPAPDAGCDLLSFYYLCRTGNNLLRPREHRGRVVICFHFTIFVVLETTFWLLHHQPGRLWFAFILLSLSYWKQHYVHNRFTTWVVICFHFTIFVVLETTFRGIQPCCRLLWFAFILLSLSYWKQLWYIWGYFSASCDLLSFYYLCRTGNNPDCAG